MSQEEGGWAQINKGLRVEAAHLQQHLSDLSERIAVPNLGMCPPMGNITSLITTVIGSVWGRRGVRKGVVGRGVAGAVNMQGRL